jgi:hypothetical protein
MVAFHLCTAPLAALFTVFCCSVRVYHLSTCLAKVCVCVCSHAWLGGHVRLCPHGWWRRVSSALSPSLVRRPEGGRLAPRGARAQRVGQRKVGCVCGRPQEARHEGTHLLEPVHTCHRQARALLHPRADGLAVDGLPHLCQCHGDHGFEELRLAQVALARGVRHGPDFGEVFLGQARAAEELDGIRTRQPSVVVLIRDFEPRAIGHLREDINIQDEDRRSSE